MVQFPNGFSPAWGTTGRWLYLSHRAVQHVCVYVVKVVKGGGGGQAHLTLGVVAGVRTSGGGALCARRGAVRWGVQLACENGSEKSCVSHSSGCVWTNLLTISPWWCQAPLTLTYGGSRPQHANPSVHGQGSDTRVEVEPRQQREMKQEREQVSSSPRYSASLC